MDNLLKALKKEIEANAEISFTISDVESMVETSIEADDIDPPREESPSQRYTDTQLTDDAVATMEGWLDDPSLHMISDEVVTHHLDEILILLIVVRDGACVKELRHDMWRIFGADLSPGTVYPHLNELADEGVLDVRELTKRKVYRLFDANTAINRVDQHTF